MRKNREKLLSVLLAVALCLGLAPTGAFAADMDASGGAPSAGALPATADTYDTLEIYLENRDVWALKQDRYFEEHNYSYGLFDLEGDGIPELYSSGMGGTGFFSDNKFYKVDPAARSVYQMQDLPDALNSIDLSHGHGLEIYQDKQTGRLLYYCSDYVRKGWEYNGTTCSFFYKADDTVSMRTLWGWDCNVDENYTDQYTYYYCTDAGERVEVSEQDWDRYQENYLGRYTLLAGDVPAREAAEIHRASDAALKEMLDDMYHELYQMELDSIAAETILRAKLLTVDHSFSFYRTWESPVRVMAKQLDPYSATSWYTVENLLSMYYKTVKNGGTQLDDVGEVTATEFYEYLLFKLLDGDELEYVSIAERFGLIDGLPGGEIGAVLVKKLASAGFKAGTEITDENFRGIKKVCEKICGTDSLTDVGWMDAVSMSKKTIDDFATEFVKLYALVSVSDARAEAIRSIGANTQNPALSAAAANVYSSIQQAKKNGIEYCVSGGLENSLDYLAQWSLGKMVDELAKIHPSSVVWKKTADTATSIMDTVFRTKDISTDTIYVLGMANVEKALLNAIEQQETAFQNDTTLGNAQHLIALAGTLKQELLAGCDLVTGLVDHTERGDLNWHGILDLLSMAEKEQVDFIAILKWIFGDASSTYAQMRESLANIKKTIEQTDFYAGSVSVLELLREVKTTTPSTWASGEVTKAINYGILPNVMQNNYQTHITRIEFCALLEYMIEAKIGKTALELADEQGGYIQPPFDDALYMEVNDIARLGIINGVGGNCFNPLGEITRQEAATMLYRTAGALGYDTAAAPAKLSGVADWADQGVSFVTARGIMNGTGDGFDPLGKYTKEQAILTMVRFYENIK